MFTPAPRPCLTASALRSAHTNFRFVRYAPVSGYCSSSKKASWWSAGSCPATALVRLIRLRYAFIRRPASSPWWTREKTAALYELGAAGRGQLVVALPDLRDLLGVRRAELTTGPLGQPGLHVLRAPPVDVPGVRHRERQPTSCDFRSPTLRSAPITQAWVKPFMMLVGRLLEESQAPML